METDTKANKPVHAKPQLYAQYFLQLKEIAKYFGFNLVVHGSMNRDLDLIAIPWIDNPKPELEMIHELHKYITGHTAHTDHWKEIYMFSELPGGRHSYVINVNRSQRDKQGNYQEDPQYYIDISVVQSITQEKAKAFDEGCEAQKTVCAGQILWGQQMIDIERNVRHCKNSVNPYRQDK